MMKDLKGSINRDSDHYKSLKDGLLSSRREYISEKKQRYYYFIISFHDSNHHLFNSKLFHFSYFEDVNEDSTSSEGEDDLDESATETLLKTVEEVDVNSTEKVCEWFEER